ncbi:hypothetical protein H9P43_003231 [Blastocladiella emersonii ATCC 22665]|nr:hypothetical protein H9P43_003231 [Blastocladiella emersonii ATCC 22665]
MYSILSQARLCPAAASNLLRLRLGGTPAAVRSLHATALALRDDGSRNKATTPFSQARKHAGRHTAVQSEPATRRRDGPRRTSPASQSKAEAAAPAPSRPTAATKRQRLHYSPPPADLPWSSAASPRVAAAIQSQFGFETCTPVQATVATRLTPAADAVVQAKTGTGKTVAYLVSVVEQLLANLGAGSDGVRALVVAPTRELATQIAGVAKTLASPLGLRVAAVIGGESRAQQLKTLRDFTPAVVVTTPGRLVDLLSDASAAAKFAAVEAMVLDEADRMLEGGFQDDLVAITRALPAGRYRTLLFSATFPANVQALAQSTLRAGFTALSTVSANDPGTVHGVRQFYAVAGMASQPSLVHAVLHRHATASPSNFKAMVFLPTTTMTELYAALFRALPTPLDVPVWELHSRLPPSVRTRAAAAFRDASAGVLFTSDVSARGVDYPGVALVVQVGPPPSRDAYVHRIGRTARAGEKGTGLLVLAPFERTVLDALAEVPLVKLDVVNGNVDLETGVRVPKGFKWDGSKSQRLLRAAAGEVAAEDTRRANLAVVSAAEGRVAAAYLGMLGFYQGQIDVLSATSTTPLAGSANPAALPLSGYSILKELNAFAAALGLRTLPALPSALRGTFAAPQSYVIEQRARSAAAASAPNRRAAAKILGAKRKSGEFKALVKGTRRKPMLDNEFSYRRGGGSGGM